MAHKQNTMVKDQNTVPFRFPDISIKQTILFYLLTIIGSILLGLILKANSIFLPFDRFMYELIYTMPHPFWLTNIIWFFDHNYITFTIHPSFLITLYALFLLYVYFWKRSLFWWAFLSIIISLILNFIIVSIDTAFVFRTRPFFVLPNHVTQIVRDGLKGWTSYPSGHTRDTMSIAFIIGYFLPRIKYFLYFLAVFVGFSRIYLGIHFPTDVLSGLLIGGIIGYLTLCFTGILKRKKESYKSK